MTLKKLNKKKVQLERLQSEIADLETKVESERDKIYVTLSKEYFACHDEQQRRNLEQEISNILNS